MSASRWMPCALLLAACGDNLTTPIEPEPDAPPIGFVAPTPVPVVLSAAGPDQLQSAVAGPSGTFYVAGFSGATGAGPFRAVIAQLSSSGALVPAFGTNGVVTTDLVVPGVSDEIDLAVQPDGKLVLSATVAAAAAGDRDVAVARFGASGQLDTTFGVNGVRVLDLSTTGNGSTVVDGARALALGADGSIYVHAVQRAEGNISGGNTPRIDSEFTVVRLTSAGALDTAWGTGGKHLLDLFVGGMHSNATPRFIVPTADGGVLAGGYSNAIGTVQPVLFRLSSTGARVTTFASDGVYHDTILAMQTEVYNIAVHGNFVVTGGYGRQSGTANDWVSLRFNLTTGARDTSWGGTSNGAVVFDPSGTALGSNLRSAVALSGGRTLFVGSTGPANMASQDAVFAVLDANGKLDTKFGTGIVKYALGSNGNDALWAGAVNGDRALLVGYKGGLAALAAQTAAQNDDSYAVLLPLQ